MPNQITLDELDYTISDIVLKNISEKRIYFGHQSVGNNIVLGVNDVLIKNPGVQLNIVQSTDESIFNVPVFAHSALGENTKPELKTSDFYKLINNGIGENVDIAFFKFCYLDIDKTTNIDKVFSVYKDTMQQLKKEYPRTKFVHVTVPLTIYENTIRSYIKKLIGRQDNNINRNEFNNKLINEYGNKDPIFDLAKIESTYPDGTRINFTMQGNSYYSLAPEYSTDGAHLNEIGRLIVAHKLLTFLSEIK